jgi:hypothetical protein
MIMKKEVLRNRYNSKPRNQERPIAVDILSNDIYI